MPGNPANTARRAELAAEITADREEHLTTYDLNTPERNRELRERIEANRTALLNVGRRG